MGLRSKEPTKHLRATDADIRDLVLAELKRLRTHPLLSETTRASRLLSYIVHETLDGRAENLKGYTIGLEVFDRPESFDSQADTIVRVQAGQLRRRLDLYYGDDGRDNEVRIIIPKGTYKPVFEIRKPTEIVPVGDGTGIDLDAKVASIEKDQRPGLAVLTFQDISSDKKGTEFTEGLTIEIVNSLVQFRSIRIVSRMPSVKSFGGGATVTEFKEKFNVEFVLSGSVRRNNDMLRVSVNLLSTETGEHVFSKSFDQEYSAENIFEIQDEIASYTAAVIAAPYGAVNRYCRRNDTNREKSLPAYEAILKYYQMNLSLTRHKALELLEEFEGITRRTPRFSTGWAICSSLNTFLVAECIPANDPVKHLAEAIRCGTRACAIDPENALAFFALFQAYYHDGQLEIAEKMAEKAIRLNPNDYIMLAYYAAKKATDGDLVSASLFQQMALEKIDRAPMWFYGSSLVSAIQQGRFTEVTKLIPELAPDIPGFAIALGLCCHGHVSGNKKTKAFIEQMVSKSPNFGDQVKESVSYWHPNPHYKEVLEAGWRKAGLKFSD